MDNNRNKFEVLSCCSALIIGLFGIVMAIIGIVYYGIALNYNPDVALRAQCQYINHTIRYECSYSCNCDENCETCFNGIKYHYYATANRTGLKCNDYPFKIVTYDTGCVDINDIQSKILDVNHTENITYIFPCWSSDCNSNNFSPKAFCVGGECEITKTNWMMIVAICLLTVAFILIVIVCVSCCCEK
eukprot:437129_1